MKKLMTLMLVILTTSIFAADWYSAKELMTDLKPMEFSKDTVWYGYGSPAWGWGLTEERATFYNLEDFGFEYPVTLHAMTSYLLDNGNDYSYKIYDKDGVTVLFQTAESTAFEGYNDYYFSPDSLIIFDDFYMAIVPAAAGGPGAVTSDIVTESNSYLGGPGAWEPMLINDTVYELINYIALSPFNGPDIFPPTVKSVLGAATFMDMDIQLEMIAQDPNGVLTPVTAEYTIDGGTTWTPVTLNEAKGYHTFKGVIPAQVDGTIGAVRFNMSDTLANAGVSKEFEINWSKDNYILDESFEGIAFPPDGWTLNTAGADWIQFARTPAYVNVRTGEFCASHNDDNIAAIETDWLISPPINIPATNSCTLSFWQTGRYISYLESHEVAISIDGGTTWTTIYTDADAGNADVQGELTEELFSLGTYQGETILIGWAYTGDYSDEWYIDDVTLRYDYEGPQIVDVIGNEALRPTIGAYLNNDLVLSMTAFDKSGIKSITGHYSYDGGTTWTDIAFAAAKAGEELWTATIPAESAAIAGIVNFDLVDLGDVASPTTMDYNFEFVPDSVSPLFTYVTGTEAYINDPMNLTIVFTDESAISSCSGSYSKDGFVTQYDFELTPSKVHEYTYVGTIPAETVEVYDGEVFFTIYDEVGNGTTTANYTVMWRDGQVEFWEDFETGTDGWYLGGNWDIVEENEYTSPTWALTESPGGNYGPDESSVATPLVSMDWSTYYSASMSFWCKYDIEKGFDYMYFDVTKDNGLSWTTLKTWDGEGVAWHEEKVNLDAFVGTNGFNFRFRWSSDPGYEVNGMYIDDIMINTNNTIPPFGPVIYYTLYEPEYFEGALYDFTNNVDVFDISGVGGVEVIYSVDGTPQTNVVATHVSAEQWEFTIPAQPAGSVIDYTFWATDTDGHETFHDETYTIIAGEHQIYDDCTLSYYNTTEGGDAKAVRMTVPGSDATTTFGADLPYIMLRSYSNGIDHISDDITVRVWQDDGTGQPGVEVLTPFDVYPEANYLEDTSAMTMIDLRSEALRVYGDFWIGWSSENGIIYGTQEDTGETGTPAYNRSYDGAYNGDGTWTWSQYTGTNYHFRAILAPYVGIENDNIPLTTALEQNYPNPFNPETTINFTIAEDVKVSLVVYDVMGRAVAKLVDDNLSQGSHKVSLDASSMVSGVYYYNLKAGDVDQTKKMMLIK